MISHASEILYIYIYIYNVFLGFYRFFFFFWKKIGKPRYGIN